MHDLLDRLRKRVARTCLPAAQRWRGRYPTLERRLHVSSSARRVLLSPDDPRYAPGDIAQSVPPAGPTELHMVLGESDVPRAVWSLQSFFHSSGLSLPVVLHSDGTLRKHSWQTLERRFPGCRLGQGTGERLSGYPRCQSRRGAARRVLDVMLEARGDYVLLMDGATLWFERSPGLAQCLGEGKPFYVDCESNAYASTAAYLDREWRLPAARGCNPCLLGFPVGRFCDLPFLEWALALLPGEERLLETVLYALLFARHGAVRLNRRRSSDQKAHAFGLDALSPDDCACWCFTNDPAWNGFFPIGVEHLLAQKERSALPPTS